MASTWHSAGGGEGYKRIGEPRGLRSAARGWACRRRPRCLGARRRPQRTDAARVALPFSST
eukprot:9512283-Alexandrium_andersonii.AAC.1